MKNQGFKVLLNGESLCRAGFESEHFVTHVILSSIRRELHPGNELSLHIGGLNSSENHHVTWVNKDLQLGDHLVIELVEGEFDPPASVLKRDPDELVLQEKIKYFHRLKEELKDFI
jgi:hypothetical protein